MKNQKKWFTRQKLNIKFTIMIGLIVFIPISLFSILLYYNISKSLIKQEKDALESSMNKSYAVIQKTVDLCNMSTQVVMNYQNLHDFLLDLKENREIETWKLMEHYKNDIGLIERMVNSNPYLYQIRVYANNNSFTEMMPILYQRRRLEKLPWSGRYRSGEWQFDYRDTIFSRKVSASNHTMSLVTSIEDYEVGEIGLMEVAVRMDVVFPEIFQTNGQQWSCFVDKNKQIYTEGEEGKTNQWDTMEEEIVQMVEDGGIKESYQSVKMKGENVILGVMPVKELSGYIICISSIEKGISEIKKEGGIFFGSIVIAFILIIYIINLIVNRLLTQFYRILDKIREIQKGNTDIRIEVAGTDEMGELGININSMLDTIHRLMKDNMDRELLMKNSEIRALQNQINAHFIYNVLESIKMMAEVDEKYEISDSVTSLGKLLRYGMRWSGKNVTVEQEIDYIKNYLELVNLRFDYHVGLALTIPENVYRQSIPKMTLQPIIENAIYHGIEELAEDASIYIKAIVKEEDYMIEITDSGKGMTEEQLHRLLLNVNGELDVGGGSGNGIGLKNVQDRIRISYGEDYGIGVFSKVGCFTKVVVKLPFTQEVSQ